VTGEDGGLDVHRFAGVAPSSKVHAFGLEFPTTPRFAGRWHSGFFHRFNFLDGLNFIFGCCRRCRRLVVNGDGFLLNLRWGRSLRIGDRHVLGHVLSDRLLGHGLGGAQKIVVKQVQDA
jgi:hypothetical protein